MALDLKTRPNTIPWPPLIFATACVAAFALEHIAPTGVPLPRGIVFGGGVVIALGLGLDLWAMATMMRARTNIAPYMVGFARLLMPGGPDSAGSGKAKRHPAAQA